MFNSRVKDFKYNCNPEGWNKENLTVCIKDKSKNIYAQDSS